MLGLAVLCASPAVSRAQEIIGTTFEYTFPASLSQVAPAYPNLELALATYTADVGLPIQIDATDTVLVPGLRYRGSFPSVSNGPEDALDNFHELGPRLIVLQRLPSDWALVAQFLPVLATNFEDIDADHVRYGGVLLAQYRFGPWLRLGFGVIASHSFGELLPLPALDVDWWPGRFRLTVMAPVRARAAFAILPWLEVGTLARLHGNRYILSSPVNPEVESLQTTIVDVSGLVSARLHHPIWIALRGGHTVYRRFELRDGGGAVLGGTDIDNAPIAMISVVLRPD